MSIDFDALVLGAAYQTFGAAAAGTTNAGIAFTLTVQDHTAGVQIGERGQVMPAGSFDSSFATTRPAYSVRASELTEKALALADLKGGTLTLRGRTWRIKAHAQAPMDGPGEYFLFVEATDE